MKAGTILAGGQVKIKVLMRLSVVCWELQAVVPLSRPGLGTHKEHWRGKQAAKLKLQHTDL